MKTALVTRPEHRYVSFLNIALVLNRITGEWTVENVNEEFALLLTELGHEWLKYYEDTTYEFMKVKVAEELKKILLTDSLSSVMALSLSAFDVSLQQPCIWVWERRRE